MLYKLQDFNVQTFNTSHATIEDFELNSDTEIVYQDLKFNNRPACLFDRKSRMLSADFQSDLCETWFDYYDTFVDHFFKYIKLPTMVIETEGSFTNLDRVRYKPATIKYLNKKGLHIYLRELPYFRTHDKFPRCDTGTYVMENVEDWNIWKRSILGFDGDCIKSVYEFDVIEKFAKQNKLSNVHVYCGLDNIDNLNYLYPTLKLHTHDIILPALTRPANFTSMSSYTANQSVPNSSSIDYKFLSLNKRYDGVRELVVNYLHDKQSLLSYYPRNVDFSVVVGTEEHDGHEWQWYWDNIDRRLWTDYNTLEYKPKLKPLGKMVVDKVVKQQGQVGTGWNNFNDESTMIDSMPVATMQKCFAQVVCESWYAFPFGHFSDKTLVPLKIHRPFVVVSTPHTLQYLQKFGFKTFHEFWDESYDLETDHNKRLSKIFRVLESIDRLSIDECRTMYNRMQPILKHNYEQLKIFSSAKYLTFANNNVY